jgi:hypothetical protein
MGGKRVGNIVEYLVDRRSLNRRNDLAPAVGAALGLVLLTDQRASERRHQLRRRGDANSVDHMLAAARDLEVIKTFSLGGSERRKSALYSCGCVVVDPVSSVGQLQLLECPTHAELRSKLRRRRTDRHTV